MCEIIPFHGVKHRRRHERLPLNEGPARILPFTGIQYVRAPEEKVEAKPRRTGKTSKAGGAGPLADGVPLRQQK